MKQPSVTTTARAHGKAVKAIDAQQATHRKSVNKAHPPGMKTAPKSGSSTAGSTDGSDGWHR